MPLVATLRDRVYRNRARRGFDDWAATYSGEVPAFLEQRSYPYRELAREIATFLGPNRGPVLELGTGPGTLGRLLVEEERLSRRPIYGLDISPKMLDHARRTGAYEDCVEASAEEIPFPSATFASVYSTFMLHSLYRIDRCLSEIHRVAREGARVVVVDLFRPHHRMPLVSFARDLAHSIRWEHGAWARYISLSECTVMMSDAGFVLREIGYRGKTKHYTYGILKAAIDNGKGN